jgi:hypothetical protein
MTSKDLKMEFGDCKFQDIEPYGSSNIVANFSQLLAPFKIKLSKF